MSANRLVKTAVLLCMRAHLLGAIQRICLRLRLHVHVHVHVRLRLCLRERVCLCLRVRVRMRMRVSGSAPAVGLEALQMPSRGPLLSSASSFRSESAPCAPRPPSRHTSPERRPD